MKTINYVIIFFLLFSSVVPNNMFAADKKQISRILVYPVCLSSSDENKETIRIANSVSTSLKDANPSLVLLAENEIINAMQKAGFSFHNVQGQNLIEILKVLPEHDIFIIIEPYNKKKPNQWVKYFVGRRENFIGKGGSVFLPAEEELSKIASALNEPIKESVNEIIKEYYIGTPEIK